MKLLAFVSARPRPVPASWPRAALWLLVAVWVLLPLLASATPPDPTWIAGFYDDCDFDDVVVQIGWFAGVCDWSAPPDFALQVDAQSRALPGVPAVVCVTYFTLQDRSPPMF